MNDFKNKFKGKLKAGYKSGKSSDGAKPINKAPNKHAQLEASQEQPIKENAISIVKKHEVTLSEGVHKVQEYRQQVIKRGRKFKNPYSLLVKKKSLAKISAILAIISIIAFYVFSYIYLAVLHKDDSLAYAVSRVTPYRTGNLDGVKTSYNNYLFELRHQLHYLETRENLAIRKPENKDQYEDLKEKSLNKTLEDAWARKEANRLNISVSEDEVTQKVNGITSQFGNEGKESLDIALKTYYNWDENDLKRSIRDQLIRQKVSYALDQNLIKQKTAMQQAIKDGANFDDVVSAYSTDAATKPNKGNVEGVTKKTTVLPPEVIEAVFNMKDGEVNNGIETSKGLYFIKLNKINDNGTRNIQIGIIELQDFDKIVQETDKK